MFKIKIWQRHITALVKEKLNLLPKYQSAFNNEQKADPLCTAAFNSSIYLTVVTSQLFFSHKILYTKGGKCGFIFDLYKVDPFTDKNTTGIELH